MASEPIDDLLVIEKVKTNFGLPGECCFSVAKRVRSQSVLWEVTASCGSEERVFFVKSAGPNAEKQTSLVKRANELLRDCAFHQPSMVHYDAQHQLTISKAFRGRSLETMLVQPSYMRPDEWFRELSQVVRHAGMWLNLYHRQHGYGSVSEPLMRYLENRPLRLDQLPSDDRKLLVELVGDDIRDELVVTHGDFSPGNVLSNGDSLCVIDFGVREWMEMSPAWDVLTFLTMLDRQSLFNVKSPLYWLRPLLNTLKREFVQSYGDTVPTNVRTVQACAAVRHFSLIFSSGEDAPWKRERRARWHLRQLQTIVRSDLKQKHGACS